MMTTTQTTRKNEERIGSYIIRVNEEEGGYTLFEIIDGIEHEEDNYDTKAQARKAIAAKEQDDLADMVAACKDLAKLAAIRAILEG